MKKKQQFFLHLTVFIAGAAVLVLEILGTRVISPFYGSTIFVWSSLIAVTLGTLSLGYLIGGRMVDSRPEVRLLYQVILISAIFISFILKIDQPVLVFTDQFGIKYGPLVAALIIFAPSFLMLGMVTPIAIRLSSESIKKSGNVAGRIFAISTIGSVVGALLAGFYLLPAFSLTQTFLGLAIVLAVLSILGMIKKLPKVLIVLFLFSVTFFPKFQEKETKRIFEFVHQEQSFYGDLKIRDDGENYCLLIDGTTHSCHDKKTNKPIWSYILEIGRVVRAEKPEKVLVLGLGAGSIAKALPSGIRADFVEIDGKVANLASNFFGFTVRDNQRLFIDDARHYLRTSEEKYDMIIMDTYAGNIFPPHLFTAEYLMLVEEHLSERGVMLAFLEGKLPGEDLQLSTFNTTANKVFPSVYWTSSDLKGESFLLAHFSPNSSYEPDMATSAEMFKRPYQILSLDFSDGVLLTDDFNPLDTIATKVRASTRNKFVEIQGYTPFFSL